MKRGNFYKFMHSKIIYFRMKNGVIVYAESNKLFIIGKDLLYFKPILNFEYS